MPKRKVKGGFKIDNVNKTHKTEAGADRQLRAIKANQNRKKKGVTIERFR